MRLKHGDVFVYVQPRTLIQRAINLITGSKAIHVSVLVDNNGRLDVLEQLWTRTWTPVEGYQDKSAIDVYRPLFPVARTNHDLLRHRSYGWVLTIDHVLNHTIGHIQPGWKHKKILSRFFHKDRTDCGTLVAKCLDFYPNGVPEPDDFLVPAFAKIGSIPANTPVSVDFL